MRAAACAAKACVALERRSSLRGKDDRTMSYISRAFKAKYGIDPLAYRQGAGREAEKEPAGEGV